MGLSGRIDSLNLEFDRWDSADRESLYSQKAISGAKSFRKGTLARAIFPLDNLGKRE
jgi:hypothetical protein